MLCAFLTIFLTAPAATKAAGAAFAENLLSETSPPAIVTLDGLLGAGKTTFAQGFGEGLGLKPGEVASPTFTLADLHRGGKVAFNHLDLYRLGEAGDAAAALRDFLEAGLDECLDEGFSLIEWPERLPEHFWPEERYRLRIRHMTEIPSLWPGSGPDGSRAAAGSQSDGPARAGRRTGRILEISGPFSADALFARLKSKGLKPEPPA
ncbi:MAG: tRNA (adenosine(37)-N6)-threonylcarbamoyltransferase complex ATPase subunit type 1 TsaE [Deltaproteobacteria bacterium]|nr:tRNA (adenosine(37)-N6)-threonylcarbamoyltransferase complex ATPase subunit type 1 TsaE [Deltaproteobacteria bacterium]